MKNTKPILIFLFLLGNLTAWGQQKEERPIKSPIDYTKNRSFGYQIDTIIELKEAQTGKTIALIKLDSNYFRSQGLVPIKPQDPKMPTVTPPQYKNIPLWKRAAKKQALIISPK